MNHVYTVHIAGADDDFGGSVVKSFTNFGEVSKHIGVGDGDELGFEKH